MSRVVFMDEIYRNLYITVNQASSPNLLRFPAHCRQPPQCPCPVMEIPEKHLLDDLKLSAKKNRRV